ncbi:MAG: endolytic transglycosylase MltG [Nitrospirota bacterium]
MTTLWSNLSGVKRLPIVIFVISIAFLFILSIYSIFLSPPSSKGEWREFVVTEGMTFSQIAEKLKQEGFIRSSTAFNILGRVTEITRSVRAGYYSLNVNMNLLNVFDIIKKGKIIVFEIIVPEGSTLFDIGRILERKGLAKYDDFISLTHDSKFVDSFGIEAPSLEGYLFPDKYLFPKGISLKEITGRMVNRFFEVFDEDLAEHASEIGFTVNEVITLASIIEMEASVDGERALISAVYHNRLKKRMKLQADPTAVYGKDNNKKITKKDLNNSSPYNTYRIKGLPPGPISNPGLKSIKAALNPEDVKYLFFVSKNDGTHYFSMTEREHNLAVEKFRALRSLKNGESPNSKVSKNPSLKDPSKTL